MKMTFQEIRIIAPGPCIANQLRDVNTISYESEFLQKLVKDKKIHEAKAFNFTYRYIDDVLSINNSRFAEFLPLIYPPELILKNSKDLLEYIQSRSLSSCNSIKTFDFSTLYTTIPHSKLKLVQLGFIKKNGQCRYKYLVLGRDRSYFVKHHSDSTKKFSETDIFNMLECSSESTSDSHHLSSS
jgi:hypothetical protein